MKSDTAAEDAVSGTRRSTLASRLEAVYGPGNVDKSTRSSAWSPSRTSQARSSASSSSPCGRSSSEALRDGDRFFYLNDPLLSAIRRQYGIDYRHTLADIIRMNSGVAVRANVFKVPPSTPDTG